MKNYLHIIVGVYLILARCTFIGCDTTMGDGYGTSMEDESMDKIYCEAAGEQDENEVFKYDCSRKNLNWRALNSLIDPIRASSSLNLAGNELGNETGTIRNLSFNLFKQLVRLNLSSNYLTSVEPNAFYYLNKVGDADTDYSNMEQQSLSKPLLLGELDLSDNLFRLLPWNALKSLPHLTYLYMSRNPLLRTFDLGDFAQPPVTVDGQSYFAQLTHVYVNKSQIEYVDPIIFRYLTQLQVLDLSGNSIRHLSIDILNQLNSHFERLYVANNPLICDCKLIWLKKFLQTHSDEEDTEHTKCYVNTRSYERNYLIETKSIFINASSMSATPAHFRVLNSYTAQTNRENSLKNSLNSHKSLVDLDKLSNEQFYCDLELGGQVNDLRMISEQGDTERTRRHEVELECRVRSFPEAKIKWLFGQKDLYKLSNYENKQFNIVEKSEYSAYDYEYVVDSKLIISYSGNIGLMNFSCLTFYLNDHSPVKQINEYKSDPYFLLKSINFNLNSVTDSSDELDFTAGLNQTEFEHFNSTVLMIKEHIRSSSYDKPFIYWIILAICCAFVFTVIVFAIFCFVHHRRETKRKEEEAAYAYAPSSTSYTTINKRSASYLNTNSLRMDNTALQPLKPDIIREHKDYSIISNASSTLPPTGYSTPRIQYITPNSLPRNGEPNLSSNRFYINQTPSYVNQDEPSYDRQPVNDMPSTSFATTTSTSSSSSSSKRNSTISSKFEEDIQEYLDPEFDDLRKPPPSTSKSKIQPTSPPS